MRITANPTWGGMTTKRAPIAGKRPSSMISTAPTKNGSLEATPVTRAKPIEEAKGTKPISAKIPAKTLPIPVIIVLR